MPQIQCPNCKSFKVTSRKQRIWFGLIFAALAIPWMFILIGIPFFLGGLLFALSGWAAPQDKKYNCNACHNEFGDSAPAVNA